MLFLEPWFWRFAVIAILGYWILPRPVKLVWLITTSAFFHYHFAGPAGMAPIIALGFCKYSAFLLGDAGVAAGTVFGPASVSRLTEWENPAAPLAISFLTFEFVHYLYEVRKRGGAQIRNPLHFTLFAIFFPMCSRRGCVFTT